MKLRDELIESLFARAADEEIGLVIETNNRTHLNVVMGEWQRRTNQYRDMALATTEDDRYIFLMKQTSDLAAIEGSLT